jgi:hypothetical protein
MLRILDSHRSDQYLCLLTAKTVLKVVKNHAIVFDYMEMHVIRNFSLALENVESFEDHEDTDEQEDAEDNLPAKGVEAIVFIDKEN